MPKRLVLDDFEGEWRLERVIRDRRGGQEGRLSGQAQFTRDASGLVYEEAGQLSYGDSAPMEAARRYLWRLSDAGIAVFFEDERPFHEIDLGRSMPDAMHHCEPDLYHVSYDFRRWPHWQASWRVVGPKKDYRMESRYERVV